MTSTTSTDTTPTPGDTADQSVGQPSRDLPPQPRKLTRSSTDTYLGGVCGGVAAYTGVDANLIRLLAILGTVLGFGTLLVAYVAAWILLPLD